MKKENFVNKGKSYYLSMKNKYVTAAKEAASSGDRILSEYNLQYAEHYGRVIEEKFKTVATKQTVVQKEDQIADNSKTDVVEVIQEDK